jgi:hypothetical protein
LQTTGADELIVVSAIYDHAARLRSFEILAQAAATDTGPSDDRSFVATPSFVQPSGA